MPEARSGKADIVEVYIVSKQTLIFHGRKYSSMFSNALLETPEQHEVLTLIGIPCRDHTRYWELTRECKYILFKSLSGLPDIAFFDITQIVHTMSTLYQNEPLL